MNYIYDMKSYHEAYLTEDNVIPFSLNVTNNLKTPILKVDVDRYIHTDQCFVSNSELNYRIYNYRDIIDLCKEILDGLIDDWDTDIFFTLMDMDGCVLYTINQSYIGSICPGFKLINKESTINNAIQRGVFIDVYVQQFNENLIAMPINIGNFTLCLTLSCMKGKIPSKYRSAVAFIYKMLKNLYPRMKQYSTMYTSLLELNNDYTLIVNENGFITNANAKCLNLLNLDAKDLIYGIYAENILDNIHDLFTSPFNSPNQSLKVFTRNKWKSVDLTCKYIFDHPKGYKCVAFSFREPSRVNYPVNSHYTSTFERIITNDFQMRQNISLAKKVAKLPSTILIEGESGTGKEMFAQGIHSASCRQGPFIAINCGGISRELLQSELFGYSEGAFTGAKKGGSVGKFQHADGGTVFLDEIGEMPQDMQVSLLRFLQDRIIVPLGDHHPQRVDVRVIAATNKDLIKEVKNGNFREDLYFRLNVVNLKIPPLRDRKDDIPLLAENIITSICRQFEIPVKSMTKSCQEKLQQHDWPGNVRELRNVLERAVAVSDGCVVSASHILIHDMLDQDKLTDVEKDLIITLLQKNGGNISATAKALGIARTTLYRKLKTYDIEAINE